MGCFVTSPRNASPIVEATQPRPRQYRKTCLSPGFPGRSVPALGVMIRKGVELLPKRADAPPRLHMGESDRLRTPLFSDLVDNRLLWVYDAAYRQPRIRFRAHRPSDF